MRRSIHLNPKTEQYIAARSSSETLNVSGNLNAAVEKLAYILAEAMPEISESDMAEIYNIYAGSELTRIALPVNIAADMLTHYGATLPSQIPEHCRPLIERLVTMSQAAQIALIDKAAQFWAAQ